MTISQALINGIYERIRDDNNDNGRTLCKLQNAMLKIFPLVIATSFSVESEEEMKYQYLLSQALMRVANRNGIDGIAYLSMKGIDEFYTVVKKARGQRVISMKLILNMTQMGLNLLHQN